MKEVSLVFEMILLTSSIPKSSVSKSISIIHLTIHFRTTQSHPKSGHVNLRLMKNGYGNGIPSEKAEGSSNDWLVCLQVDFESLSKLQGRTYHLSNSMTVATIYDEKVLKLTRQLMKRRWGVAMCASRGRHRSRLAFGIMRTITDL